MEENTTSIDRVTIDELELKTPIAKNADLSQNVYFIGKKAKPYITSTSCG
jgi:hypothetical protein